MRTGLTELTTSTPGLLAELAHDVERLVERCPRTGTTRAPWIRAWASLPSAICPAGSTTAHSSPARAAYAAADADVLPVDAQITTLAPCSTAFETAIVIPRSLNDPVGFAPSTFSRTLATPARSARRGASRSGVLPSSRVMTGVALGDRQAVAERLDELRASARLTRVLLAHDPDHRTDPVTTSTSRSASSVAPRSPSRAAVRDEDEAGVGADPSLLHRLDRHAVVAELRWRSRRARPGGRPLR